MSVVSSETHTLPEPLVMQVAPMIIIHRVTVMETRKAMVIVTKIKRTKTRRIRTRATRPPCSPPRALEVWPPVPGSVMR